MSGLYAARRAGPLTPACSSLVKKAKRTTCQDWDGDRSRRLFSSVMPGRPFLKVAAIWPASFRNISAKLIIRTPR